MASGTEAARSASPWGRKVVADQEGHGVRNTTTVFRSGFPNRSSWRIRKDMASGTGQGLSERAALLAVVADQEGHGVRNNGFGHFGGMNHHVVADQEGHGVRRRPRAVTENG